MIFFKRLTIVWLLGLAIALLTLSVAALIVVFAVEHSWFHDSFNFTNTNFVNQTYSNQYGLWRLCFFPNQTCDNWFSSNSSSSFYVTQRLDQAKG